MQDLGRRRLLLQRLGQIVGALAQFLEQARVFDGDDGLRGEIADQLNLLIGERPHFLPIDDDGADQLSFLEHRHRQQRPDAGDFYTNDGKRIALLVRLFLPQVGDVDHLLCQRNAAEAAARSRMEQLVLADVRIARRRVKHGDGPKCVVVTKKHIAEIRSADTGCVLQHGLENRLKIAGRAADDLEHVGGGGLLLQRFRKIVGALAQFVEQPRVLDGDDGLLGKVGDQLDLLVGERTDLVPEDGDGADKLAVLDHRNDEKRPDTDDFHADDDHRVTLDVRLVLGEIDDMNDLFCSRSAHDRRVLARPQFTAPNERHDRLGDAERRDRQRDAVLDPEQDAEIGVAQSRGVRQHGIEHRLQFAGRT